MRPHLHLLQDAVQELLSIVLAPITPAAVMIARRPQEPAHAGKLAQDPHISSLLMLPMCHCHGTSLLQAATSRASFMKQAHQHALLQASLSIPCLLFSRMKPLQLALPACTCQRQCSRFLQA